MLGSRRILQVAHSHPRFHPGGTEITALALHHEAIRQGADSWYLGVLNRKQVAPKPGTNMVALTPDSREAAIYVHEFDTFRLSQPNNYGFIDTLHDYLSHTRPDVVHVHHVLGLGLESLFVIRASLPEAKIVLTLHDYYLICANFGQLFKTDAKLRCDGPELAECLRCFPERKSTDFELRALDVQNALSLCDHIVSPSWFLKQKFERYIAAPLNIEVIENGYVGTPREPAHRISSSRGGVLTFGYFGNISPIKGLSDLLDAADLLQERKPGQFNIIVHGSQLYKDQPLYDRMMRAQASLGYQLRYAGRYRQEDVGTLMSETDCVVFPSIWWENAPLVIYEALHNQCPVISYPHGGAPEILKKYGVGIVAKRSDPLALADAMEMALSNLGNLQAEAISVPGRDALLSAYAQVYIRSPSETEVRPMRSSGG